MNSTQKYDARPSHTFTRGSRVWTVYCVLEFVISFAVLVVYLLGDGLEMLGAAMVSRASAPIAELMLIPSTVMVSVDNALATVCFLVMITWTLCGVADCLQVRWNALCVRERERDFACHLL